MELLESNDSEISESRSEISGVLILSTRVGWHRLLLFS
jgi:hypothetical protein